MVKIVAREYNSHEIIMRNGTLLKEWLHQCGFLEKDLLYIIFSSD